MGCDCCRVEEPKMYAQCEEWRKNGKKRLSPCGAVELNEVHGRGRKFTEPKKKRKRKK